MGTGALLRVVVGLELVGCITCSAAAPTPTQGIDRETYLQRVAPDLAIAQAAEPSVVRTGTNITITLTVTNRRPASAPKVVVADVLPESTTFVSCASTNAGVCGGSVNDRAVTFEALAGGVTATVTLVATLKREVPNGTRVTNTARVTFEGTDPNPADNVVSATFTAQAP
jgi:uncharacterized repeat protein (TIGR01451 family)